MDFQRSAEPTTQALRGDSLGQVSSTCPIRASTFLVSSEAIQSAAVSDLVEVRLWADSFAGEWADCDGYMSESFYSSLQ